MFKQKKWLTLFAMFLFGLALEVVAPESFTRTANAEVREKAVQVAAVCVIAAEEYSEPLSVLSTEEVWADAYFALMYAEENAQLRQVMTETRELELQLMTNATDHIVNYHGRRFAITDDEYQVLLKIVEAEAPDEDIAGKMLVANVVLNRLEIGFGGNTISEVVFARNQFEPVSNGRFFMVTPTESTIEAVERVLKGEDESQGALYFMARAKASKSGIRWFDNNLQFLFKHGNHEFFTEKE